MTQNCNIAQVRAFGEMAISGDIPFPPDFGLFTHFRVPSDATNQEQPFRVIFEALTRLRENFPLSPPTPAPPRGLMDTLLAQVLPLNATFSPIMGPPDFRYHMHAKI